MNAAILDGFAEENYLQDILKETLSAQNLSYTYLKLKDLAILPCASCGSCGLVIPGRCVLKDETPQVMRAIAKSEIIILLTPIVFGGYSAQLKKAMDKMMLAGLPLYFAANGRLFHPSRYGRKALLAIGMAAGHLNGEENNFRLLVERNAQNLQYSWHTIVCKPADHPPAVRQHLADALTDVTADALKEVIAR